MIVLHCAILLVFAAVHLLVPRVLQASSRPRSAWLSFAGGAAIAFFFLHLLPELAAIQEEIQDSEGFLPWLDQHSYLFALVGLIVFYFLEAAMRSQKGKEPKAGFFVVHISLLAFYNFLIGFLLMDVGHDEWLSALVYAVAMGFHLLTNDYDLAADFPTRYTKVGRWVLALMPAMGYGLATVLGASAPFALLALAFVIGGGILIIFKEELPSEKESRFGPFAGGALLFSLLLLFLHQGGGH